MNPFFAEGWTTPFAVPPFDEIDEGHFAPAFDEAMARHTRELEAITTSDEPPTFENTIVALERSGLMLDGVTRVFFHFAATLATDTLQALQKQYAPRLSRHHDTIVMTPALFKRIQQIHDSQTERDLGTEALKLVRDYHRDFIRAGAALSERGKKRLMQINARLATLFTNVQEALREENKHLLVIEDEDDLRGIGPQHRSAAAALAKARGHFGKWAFSLVRSSYEPFLQYAANRELRRLHYEAFHRRGGRDNAHDTRPWILEIVALRAERAELLGFASHAEYVTAGNMAGTPQAVYGLMNEILKGSLARLQEDRVELQKLIEQDIGPNATLEPWDWRFYAERLRKVKHDFSADELPPYLELNAVRRGAFETASLLFGIHFEEVTQSVPCYHPDVRAFEVTDTDGSHIGLLYLDYFARENKRSGAWMDAIRGQRNLGGKTRPVIVNVANFPPPTEDGRVLLGWTEVITLFHEFGHALHGLLSDVTYPRLAGTSVKRDFVELPSQLLENWAYAPQIIEGYAKHHETGAPLPKSWIAKIRNSAKFNQGALAGEYVAAALLDLQWHTKSVAELKEIRDVNAFDRQTMDEIGMAREIAPRYYSPYFQHIFSDDGYAAGYYVYGWAEVLEADVFEAFEESGDLFDPQLCKKLREFLFSAGSRQEEMELFVALRGREPRAEPLLRKRGLTLDP